MLSPFADYVANEIEHSKEILELCIKKISIGEYDIKSIFRYFDINYDGRTIEDNDIKNKSSKSFYAFFESYLKDSEKLKEEYNNFLKKFNMVKEHYKQEIEKFNYRQNKNSYESILPYTNDIQGITREFPVEESDNISNFLDNEIRSLYPNNKENKEKYLIFYKR